MKPMTVAEWADRLRQHEAHDDDWDRVAAALEHRERLMAAVRGYLDEKPGSSEQYEYFEAMQVLVAEGKDGDA